MQPYCNNGQPERDITHSRCVHRTLPMRLPENNAPRREPAISIMSRSDVRKHRAGVPRLPIRQLREESVIPVESTRAPPPHHYDSTSSHGGPGVTCPPGTFFRHCHHAAVLPLCVRAGVLPPFPAEASPVQCTDMYPVSGKAVTHVHSDATGHRSFSAAPASSARPTHRHERCDAAGPRVLTTPFRERSTLPLK